MHVVAAARRSAVTGPHETPSSQNPGRSTSSMLIRLGLTADALAIGTRVWDS